MKLEGVIAIWGTGSLCERYLALPREHQIEPACFIDSTRTGEFLGQTIIGPASLTEYNLDKVVICSTFVNEVVPLLIAAGFEEYQIGVVLPRTLALKPLSDFQKLDGDKYYYLPWTSMTEQLSHSMSSDIIFPDVYKELVKSIAYVFIASVEGDFAEFGTCSGYSASLIARTIDYYSKHLASHENMHSMAQRKLCLFDSFQGFPVATKTVDTASPHVASGAWGEGTAKGLNSIQLEELCGKFIDKERINIYEGWYKDTLSTIESNRTFAFVHLDCDLYESTYDVLYHLLENQQLSEGAKLLFDNWYCNKASKHFGEQKAWNDICEKFEIEYTNIGLYACVGHKIIIHSYKKRSI